MTFLFKGDIIDIGLNLNFFKEESVRSFPVGEPIRGSEFPLFRPEEEKERRRDTARLILVAVLFVLAHITW